MAEDTFIRPRAFVQPMTSATMQIPFLDITTAQAAGVSAFFGGMQATWTAEAQTRSEYEPQFKQLELRPWELSAYSVSSNVLLQDSAIGLEKFLMTLFAKVIGWTEEYAFLQGNGVGKPLGMLNASACIATGGGGLGSNQRDAANAVSFNDIATMISRLLPSSLQRAIWAVHPYTLPQLIQLKDGANRVVWVNALGGATEKVPGYLFGRPVFITEKLPALGTKGDVMLVDPGPLHHRRPHEPGSGGQRARQLPQEPDDLARRRTGRRPAVARQGHHPGRRHQDRQRLCGTQLIEVISHWSLVIRKESLAAND
jgi:HK97 family phage major capsid protein